jgi:hypothetical protein
MTEPLHATSRETVPAVWTATDEQFFAVVRDLFTPAFLYGAGVLLSSYDADTAPVVSTRKTCGQPHPCAAEPAGTMVAEVSWPS